MINMGGKQLRVEVYKVKSEGDEREGVMVRFECDDEVFEFVGERENVQEIALLILRSCDDA